MIGFYHRLRCLVYCKLYVLFFLAFTFYEFGDNTFQKTLKNVFRLVRCIASDEFSIFVKFVIFRHKTKCSLSFMKKISQTLYNFTRRNHGNTVVYMNNNNYQENILSSLKILIIWLFYTKRILEILDKWASKTAII